jgi:dolichyl-phosphate beta-glucosyltransferase
MQETLLIPSSEKRIGLIVPCYNEGLRLKPNLFLELLIQQPHLDLFFVNDGSQDDTVKILEEMAKQCHSPHRITLLNLPYNQGKGEAVRQGFLKLLPLKQYSIIGYWDADLATPLTEIQPMLNHFTRHDNIQVVIGSRVKLAGWNIKRSMLRHYLGRIFCTFIDSVFKLGVYDTQCGSKFFKTEALEGIFEYKFITHWIFDVEILLRIQAKCQNCKSFFEVPLNSWADIGASKVHFSSYIQAGLNYVKLIWFYRLNSSFNRRKR